MGELPESFVEIDGILVDLRLFTTHFICDVVLQDCRSACCHQGCIVTPAEIERIRPHMDGIMEYLPEGKREFLRRQNGNFIAGPEDPASEIRLHEKWSMIRFFKSASEMQCTWIVDDSCVFLYPADQAAHGHSQAGAVHYCAVHSYALDQGIDWKGFKQADCVQYPLCLYRSEGRSVLAVQEEPGRARVPCLNRDLGPLMYRSLGGTITYLLGPAFNDRVQAYGREHFPE